MSLATEEKCPHRVLDWCDNEITKGQYLCLCGAVLTSRPIEEVVIESATPARAQSVTILDLLMLEIYRQARYRSNAPGGKDKVGTILRKALQELQKLPGQ
mgnify:CR=1 FL=1